MPGTCRPAQSRPPRARSKTSCCDKPVAACRWLVLVVSQQLPSGQQAFIEVKTGASAGLTPNLSIAFPEIWANGAIPRGANAAAAGLTPGVPIGPTPVWTVYYPWPLP